MVCYHLTYYKVEWLEIRFIFFLTELIFSTRTSPTSTHETKLGSVLCVYPQRTQFHTLFLRVENL